MKLWIDADGCPVVRLAVKIAAEYGVTATLVCDVAHIFRDVDAEVITVDTGADSVDFALVNRIADGDVVVTQDYGLAAMVLARGGRPLTQNGVIISDANLGGLLESRSVAKKIRRSGGRLKGPAPRTEAQNTAFEAALRKLLCN